VRSNLQVAIASLSSLAWNIQETPFRLPRLTMFFWISATALRSGSLVSEWPDVWFAGSTHTVNCPIASNTD